MVSHKGLFLSNTVTFVWFYRRYDNAVIWIEPVTDLLQIPGSYGFNCKHQTIAQLVVMLAKILQTKRAADVEPERALNSFSQH